MSEIITVGLYLAKNVFQAHGAECSGRAFLRKKLKRDQVLAFSGLDDGAVRADDPQLPQGAPAHLRRGPDRAPGSAGC